MRSIGVAGPVGLAEFISVQRPRVSPLTPQRVSGDVRPGCCVLIRHDPLGVVFCLTHPVCLAPPRPLSRSRCAMRLSESRSFFRESSQGTASGAQGLLSGNFRVRGEMVAVVRKIGQANCNARVAGGIGRE
jgi:hypothetical protein